MALEAPAELAARCRPIELLVTDVDGVLTDGVIAIDDRGHRDQAFPRPRRNGIQPLAPGGQAGGDPLGPPPRSRRPPRGRAENRAMCSRGTNTRPLRFER